MQRKPKIIILGAGMSGIACALSLHDNFDVHIYENHIQQVKTQLQRKPLNLPRLELLNKPKNIGLYSPDKIHFHEYSPHPHISAPVAI